MAENDTPFKIPFLKKEQLTKDTFSFYFKRTPESRDFTPGQYFEINLPIRNADDGGRDRSFTCCSSPTEKGYYMITTRILESSFKMALAKLKPGTLVRFNGPWNDLNFDETEDLPQVFMAGGIGITPFHCIVKYAVDKKLKLPITLFVSWPSYDEMIFDDFFRDAEKKLENFRYIPTITNAQDLKSWKGETGRISERLVKKYIKKVRNNKFRMAGPPGLVKAMKELCVQMNIPKENIIFEEFDGY